MKRILKTFIVLYVLIPITACSQKQKKEEKYTITGQVSGVPDGTKFYLRNLSTDAVFDSTIVEKGHFKFMGELYSTPEQIWLTAKIDKKFIYTNLLIGNDEISINGDITDFPWNVDIKGSKIQENYGYSLSITKEYDIKRDSMLQALFKLPKEKQQEVEKAVWEKIRKLDKIGERLRIEYVKTHSNTYASVINLGYLKQKLSKDTIQQIFDKYSPEIKNSKYAKIIEVYLKEKISAIGDEYHDFEGLNQKDEKVKFSDIKGEYTLIDFTSAFCGPCILAADELVEINETYSNSLTIVSFSGDFKKDVWLKSLKRDKVTWNSIWDGKGRYSETSIKYGVQGVPSFVLINQEGIIIDKWTGYRKGSLIKRIKKNL
ncbi:MAG: TlpA disulfide reductase family protein [Algibacter sp.]